MKKMTSKILIAATLCAVMLSVSCTKEVIFPVSTNLYNSLLPIWEQRESSQLHKSIDKYVSHYGYTLYEDTTSGGYRTVTYLCQTDTAIYVLKTWSKNDTLETLICFLFSPRNQWLKDQMVLFENEMYNRHPEGYTGGSFYWYIGSNSVDGGDVRSHDLFVQRTQEHANDTWEWVEARTRYGLYPPYLGEDRLELHTGGTQYYLRQVGLEGTNGITHHLDIHFNVYDTTGWNNPWILN